MGWPPAVVIVVRHGARLDAADKQWHLTSPTPYDPPLTYGGWKQSRELGGRIASILRTRETDDERLPTNGTDRRKRRHKVIIHTSPFLRCVQTSIAISAGLAQNPGHAHHIPTSSCGLKAPQMHSSPRIRPTVITGSPRLAPIPEPGSSTYHSRASDHENIRKSTIRVDAFLGEWLTPDYFELITPPPSSVMMLAGAKADLLRREDYSYLSSSREPGSATSNQGFPGGWGSPVVMAEKDKEKDDGPLSNLSGLSHALPRRDRTNSLSSVGSSGSRHSHRGASPLPAPNLGEHGVYQPPIPNYAISSSDPIPTGYVAHARDACVDVDYQWDSMREPQEWGSGGEYGEEWSSMHKRFRGGLQQMISWYSNTDDPGKVLRSPVKASSVGTAQDDHSEDDDTDLVVILVTHGAGCNALIGALTSQPVLMDVGMASLTMAVRKPTPTFIVGAPRSRPSSRTLSISDQYDVKLTANTEHLRTPSVSGSSGSRNPSIPGLSAFRERYGSSGSFDPTSLGRSRPITTNSNLGSIRRTATVANSSSRSFNGVRQSSIGLWAPRANEEDSPTEDLEDDMILTFGDASTAEPKYPRVEENAVDDSDSPKGSDEDHNEDEVAPLGLWGTPRPPGQAEKIREIGTKRRWTVNERG